MWRMGEKIGVPFGTMGRAHRAGKNLNSIMGFSQWEWDGEKEMAVDIIADNLSIGPRRSKQHQGGRKRKRFVFQRIWKEHS